ncbi:uncharacterized protein LOC143282992 [Babylonia areolata]|uniref:uncharacterized protein LOC143282992 n=1 Tax=Babylonia areolata TaxID=304850 RepID=UPI003FCF1D7C
MAFTRLVSVLCWMAAAPVTLLSVEGTVVLTGCDGGNITSTGYIYRNLYCYNLGHCESSFHWTLESKNGTTVSLATCHTRNNCKSFRSEIYIYWINPCGSRLYLGRTSKDYWGTVTCTVITNSAVDRQSCGVTFVHVTARSEVYDLMDGYQWFTYLRCYTSSVRPSSVSWTRTLDTGVTVPLGTCYDTNTCTSLEQSFLLRRSSSSSYISIRNGTRDLAGRFTCSFTDANQTETADIILNIYSSPTVSNCRIDTVHSNWSATLSCDVSHAFSSAGFYKYKVQELKMSSAYPVDPAYSYFVNYDSSDERFLEYTTHSTLSFRPSLSPYVNSTDGNTYFRGRMVHSWRLSPREEYTCVTVSICLWSNCRRSYTIAIYLPSVSIPSRPYHTCTDVSYIPETRGITCMCTADNLGVPEGRLIWSVGNVTVATGEYGVQQLLLPTDSMTRDKDGMLAVCQLDWINPQYAMLPWNIAYGPDGVQVYQRYDASNRQLIIVCHVTGLNPMTPDMVQWEGPCQGQQGFRCVLDPQKPGVDGATVKCRVTNMANNGHHAEAVSVIETGTMAATQKGEDISTSQWKWAGIAVAVTLAVEIVITLLVVFVVWLCRRGRLLSDCRKGSGRQQTDNSGTDTHHYEGLATVRERGRVPDRSPRQKPNTDNVYENTGFEQREAHM